MCQSKYQLGSPAVAWPLAGPAKRTGQAGKQPLLAHAFRPAPLGFLCVHPQVLLGLLSNCLVGTGAPALFSAKLQLVLSYHTVPLIGNLVNVCMIAR